MPYLDAVDETIPRAFEDREDVVVLWVEEDLVDLCQRDLRVAGAHPGWLARWLCGELWTGKERQRIGFQVCSAAARASALLYVCSKW